jgi:N-acetylglucosaminyl-diphospho-decaprenol L-rhamnosyltransferase
MTENAKSKRVSVIIVSYNTASHTLNLLAALQSHPVHETIVIDNASTDETSSFIKRNHPNVILVQNRQNRGFGAANNQGLDRMTGDLALLLNSDCIPEPNAINTLVQEFQDPDVIAAGGQLLNPDGTHQPSACNNLTLWAVICEQLLLEKLLPNSSVFNPYWISRKIIDKSNHPAPVSQVMGACLMLRPKERFDERFFLYCEDTELCRRLKDHGQILYIPEAKFVHALGASSTQNRWWSIAMYNRGKELYFRIHHSPIHQVICLIINRVGGLLRFLIKPRQAKQWLQVLAAPLAGPKLPSDTQ